MGIIKNRDLKIQEKCGTCHKKLPEFNRHHTLCHTCWVERQEKRGNLTVK